MGQSRSIKVALVINEDLGLVDEPPERGRVDDSVAISLKLAAVRCLVFVVSPAEALLLMRGVSFKRVHRLFGALR